MLRFKQKLNNLTPVRIIVLFYIVAIIISTALISLPIAIKPNVQWTFLDALFTAVSAVSVTGLTVVSLADTFTTTGYFIIAFIVQFGGIGIMTLGTFIWISFRKRISFRDRQLMMIDQNRSTLASLVQVMLQILKLFVIVEMIGAIILGLHFLNYFPTAKEALFQGFFASISATTNAGFDITGSSLLPFANDYFVQVIVILLLTFGVIGFPVLLEINDFLLHKTRKKTYRFSLFTKLSASTFFLLLIIGTFFIYFFDRSHFFADKSWHESFFYALFQSMTTRSSGLTTMNVAELTIPTQLLQSGLMFIGASPSSVGGGIRTTTFAIVILAIITFAKGKKSIKVFKREIEEEDIKTSFVVITVATLLCSTAVTLLAHLESFPLMAIIYEVCSAFGTTGLSLGITSELSTVGKIIIMILMFIGRIGILSFLFIGRGKGDVETFHYPKEKVIIG